MRKPKTQQKETPSERQERDFFQTPNYAADLIAPYIPSGWAWECAAGNGKLAGRLGEVVVQSDRIVQSDIEQSPNLDIRCDFLTLENCGFKFSSIVTNPPFSLKRKFFERCVYHGKPFALLLPVDFCGWILQAMRDEMYQWLIPTRRIDYITPSGRSGRTSAAQFHSGWFCYGFGLPRQITIAELTNEMKKNI